VTAKPQRPAVEELSDLQWARIERSLWSELDAPARGGAQREAAAAPGKAVWWRRRELMIGVGVALAAALVLVVWWPRPRP
jgi:ferric-dicitrate binding protein FerR (iron transport regulator)